jgi:hypothetical protein
MHEHKKKINGIRHIVELRVGVIMDKHKTRVKYLSTGDICDQ